MPLLECVFKMDNLSDSVLIETCARLCHLNVVIAPPIAIGGGNGGGWVEKHM